MHNSSPLSYYEFTLETFDIFIGIFLNAVLLLLIRHFSSAYIGNYKYLLAAFAAFDICLCSIHGILNPMVFIIKNTFAAALYAPWQSYELTSVYLGFFTVPFALMNIHFMYRYWSVAHPARTALFSQKRFVCLISLYPIAQGVVWYFLAYVLKTDTNDISLVEVKAQLFEARNDTIENGWLVMDHWRDGKLNVHVLYVIVITMVIMFGSFSSALTLASLTYREILKATTLSDKHRTTQYTLLLAVCAQTFVPLVCVYIPYFMCIISPFLSLSGYGMVDHFSLLLSLFPGWDALVIIILIKDYRQGLTKFLGLRKEKPTILMNHTQFTTSAQPSMIAA